MARGLARPRRSGRRTCRTRSCCTGSIARNTRTRFAICSPSTSTPTELLPADDIAEGFDNIATALQVSPSFIEQYVIAARAVAVKAVGRPDARPGGLDVPRRARHAAHARRRAFRSARAAAFSRKSISRPTANTVIDIADMATHIWGNGMEFENPLVVTLDNKIVYETVIGGEEDMKLYDQVQNGALDRVNARLKNIRFAATAGPHKIGVAFKRRTLRRVRRPAADVRARRRPGSSVSRELVPAAGPVRREGPQPDAEPRAHLQLPARQTQGETPRGLRQDRSSRRSAKRAYRRPVTAEDVNELLAVLPGRREGRRLRGRHPQRHHRHSGEPVLPVSRRARSRPGCVPGDTYAISDLELASKLSFFLWNTIPDDELLQLGHQRQAQRARRARQAGAAHARRSALDDAGEQLRAISGST